jgi:hypothetical protein
MSKGRHCRKLAPLAGDAELVLGESDDRAFVRAISLSASRATGVPAVVCQYE